MANPFDQFDAAPAKAPAATRTPQEFAKAYGPAAERAAKELNVDPSMLLGQWGLETAWGKSIIPGTNNLGNIKDFAGGGVAATDNMTGSRDKYRSYKTAEDFSDDFASLIKRKYPGAVGAKDPQAFAQALKAGGYAEDPRYVDKVVQASRMAGTKPNPVMEAAGKAVGALLPSANAAEANPFDQFDGAAATEGIPRVEVRGTSTDDEPSAGARFMGGVAQGTKDLGAGLVRGAGSIGATLLAPVDMARDAMAGKGLSLESNRQRRADMDAGLKELGADTDSIAYQGGKLTGEIAGTAGVGSALAAPLKAAGLTRLATAVGSGGMTTGAAPARLASARGVGDLALRATGGAIAGGASAGLVNPDDAALGAGIGAATPVATKVAGAAGRAIGRGIAGGGITPEVKELAVRAKELGIDIPADRLVNSRPLNAVAASLDYVPMSGRSATMDKMQSQLNTALSKTFGQNSDNVTAALRKAQGELGQKFDDVLKNNVVAVDRQFMQDLGDVSAKAVRELEEGQAGIINKQIDEIIDKATKTGDIDGQAAYNIKKTLDRISKRNTPEAYYARELKSKLMGALDRSLGPTKAQEFAAVRKQYGNMLSLENLAQNGAEGDISIARLANMKNINNPELQELADISAQFLKSRESQHGAMQRVVLGTGGVIAGGLGAAPAVAAGVAAGRGTNMLLNSGVARNALLNQPQTNSLLRYAGEPELAQMFYRAAPVAGSSGR